MLLRSAKLFSELQAARERTDYQGDLAFDAEDVRRHLERAAPLIEELARVLGATPGLELRELRLAWTAARAKPAAPASGPRPLPRRQR